MIHKLFAKEGYPAGAGAALMIEFRDFRSNLDAAAVERTESDPSD
jgi:hypothetical protein